MASQLWQAGHPTLRATLRGLAAAPAAPATLLASCGDDLAGRRDRLLQCRVA